MRKEAVKVVGVFLSLILAAWVGLSHAAEEGEDASDWDALSTELLSKVTDANLDTSAVLRVIRAATCTIDLTVSTPGAFPWSAKMSYSWEDSDDDGILMDAEVEIETVSVSDPNMRFMMTGIHQSLRRLATLTVRSLQTEYSAKAQKVSGGYQMTLKPKAGDEGSLQLTISNDFRVTRLRVKTADGTESVTTYTHQKSKDKWLVKTAVVNNTVPGGTYSTQEQWTIGHQWVGGVPLLSNVTIVNTVATFMGSVQTQQDYTLRNWKVTRRAKPLETTVVAGAEKEEAAAAGDTVKIEKTEEAKQLADEVIAKVEEAYFSLPSADVASFDATYAVEKDGEAVGTLNATWNREAGEVSASLEGDAEDEVKQAAQEWSVPGLSVLVSAPLDTSGAEGASAYGVKSGNQYILDFTEPAVKENPQLKSSIAFVSTNLREMRVIGFMKNGAVVEMSFRGEPVQDKHFFSGGTIAAQVKGKTVQKDEFTYKYTRREGTPFVNRLAVKRTAGKQCGDWTAVLKTVTFGKGEPEEEKEERQEAIEGLEEATKKALEETMKELIEEKKDLWLGKDKGEKKEKEEEQPEEEEPEKEEKTE